MADGAGCSGPEERSKMFWIVIFFTLAIISGIIGYFPESSILSKVFGGTMLFLAGGLAGGLLMNWLEKEDKKQEK